MTGGGTGPRVFRQRLAAVGGILVLGAAVIEIADSVPHWNLFWLSGVLTLAAGAVLFALGAGLLVRPDRRLAVAASVAIIGILVACLLTTTTDPTMGPNPWWVQYLGLADLSAGALLLVALLLLGWLALRPLGPARKPRRFPIALAATAVPTILVMVLGLLGVAASYDPRMNMSAPPPPGEVATPIDTLREMPGGGPLRRFSLVAEPATIAGREAWTFGGRVPGPDLRVTVGDRLQVRLVNHLPVATTIHWHGIDLPNAEDGVAGLTQDAVQPGASYTYEFVVRDPGTYWYHSHQDAVDQLARGLFGALVVEPPGGRVADRDYAVMMHEMPGNNDVIPGVLGYPQLFAKAVPALNGNPRTGRLEALPGERVRLRLIGAIEGETDGLLRLNGVPRDLVLVGTDYRVVALDGRDLNRPQLIGPQRIRLADGQRADLEFIMPASGSVALIDVGSADSITIGAGPEPARPLLTALPRFDLLAYGEPTPDPVAPSGRSDVTFPMVLDFTDGIRQQRLELEHTINGRSAPMMTVYHVHLGQVVRFHIVNNTDEFHSMHLHGHSFTVLSHGSRDRAGSPVLLDTLLVGSNETWDIAFRADNPGLWMLHCHVLLHAAWGMSALVAYTGVTTPYDMGGSSGNKPE